MLVCKEDAKSFMYVKIKTRKILNIEHIYKYNFCYNFTKIFNVKLHLYI